MVLDSGVLFWTPCRTNAGWNGYI